MAVIRDLKVARKILEQLGLPSRTLPLGRVEEATQHELWPTGPPQDEHSIAPALQDFDQRLAEPDEK